MQTLKKFFKFIALLEKRIVPYFTGVFGMTIFDALFVIASTNLTKQLIDVAATKNVGDIPFIVLFNFSLAVVFQLLWGFSSALYNIEAKRGTAVVQKLVFSKALRLPMKYYDEHHSGDFISKLVYDTDQATELYRSMFRRFVSPITVVIIYTIYMLILCAPVTLVLIAINIVTVIFNSFFVKPIKNIGTWSSKTSSTMTEALMNVLQGIEVVKMFGGGKKIVEQYKSENEDFAEIEVKKNLISSGLQCVNTGLNLLCLLAFLGVGVYFLSKGTTIGALAGIYAMYGMFSWQFRQVGRYFPEVIRCLVYADKLYDFLTEDEEPLDYSLPAATGDDYIKVEDLCFGYNENRQVFDKISFKINKGETVAITGASGRGKSTIAKLLLGLYQPDSGNITVAGKSFEKDGIQGIRDMISYVPQSAHIYNTTIKENIAYGKPDATMDEIIQAAKDANAHDFIQGFEDGYETIVTDINRISGGERQRIAIARAIIKNTPILLMDEATSALDNTSEKLVQDTIKNLHNNKTIIIIAHRPTTIQMADSEIRL